MNAAVRRAIVLPLQFHSHCRRNDLLTRRVYLLGKREAGSIFPGTGGAGTARSFNSLAVSAGDGFTTNCAACRIHLEKNNTFKQTRAEARRAARGARCSWCCSARCIPAAPAQRGAQMYAHVRSPRAEPSRAAPDASVARNPRLAAEIVSPTRAFVVYTRPLLLLLP